MPQKVKVHSLTGRITLPLMHKAFRSVKRNRGAPGIDKVSVGLYEKNLEQNLVALMRELKSGNYRPLPLRRLYIPKGPGSTKLRPLGIPVVRDRVAQEVVRLLLAPIFEPQFHPASFGFIPGRNCHQAIVRVLELHEQGHKVVLDADIQGFFDNLLHTIIMDAVRAEVADGNILNLVERFLTAGVCQTLEQAQEALTHVRQVLEGELGLALSAEKTKITTYGTGYAFLGFVLSSRSRRPRDKSVLKFKAKIRELTVRHCNLDAEIITKLNRVIRGTANYFATEFSTSRWMFQKLDSWIRMRLRSMKLKRKNYNDNYKLRVGYFRHKLGLLSLEEFCIERDPQGEAYRVIPRHGATSFGVAR